MVLGEVGSYIPARRVEIADLQNYLGINRAQKEIFSRFHNIQRIPMMKEGVTEDLVRPALENLFERVNVDRSEIGTFIYCHTIQQVAPFPHSPLRKLQSEFGLESAETFSLTMQNCASSITAMDVLRRRFQSNPKEKYAVVVTGEKAFSPSVQHIPHTTIMGEASTAVLFKSEGESNQVLAVKQKTLGKFSGGVGLDAATLKEFEEKYVPTLIEVMSGALSEAGLTWSELDCILPHNINLSSWKRVSKAANYPLEKIYLKDLPNQGHCFCSDVFLNYRSAVDEGFLKRGNNFLLASVGLGATFAAAVLRH